MKKCYVLIAMFALSACYYSVPATDQYAYDVYNVPSASYGRLPVDDGYAATTITTYNTPAATSSVVYIEQPMPESVYYYEEPMVVYNVNVAPEPPLKVSSIHHKVGTTPRKHIAHPIPKTPKPKPQKTKKHKKPKVVHYSSPAEGRP